MTARKNILFPVETITRELDSMLFLGVLCARRDNRVFIGRHDVLMKLSHFLEGGVYMGKDAIRPRFTRNLKDHTTLKDRGFVFMHLDTEGAVYTGGEDDWRDSLKARLDPTVLSPRDFVLTWGDFQRDHYRSLKPLCAENIRTTGHPRFDLYKEAYRSYYAPQTRVLNERYGDFILINTNLARANNKMGPGFVFSPSSGYHRNQPATRQETVEMWTYKTHVLTAFVQLVHRLNHEFPHTPIVVRPHPSENDDFYRLVFNGLENVHVVYEGAVTPWLLACKILIHDGCTTGLEAHFGDRKIINYKAAAADKHLDYYLPNLFGTTCHTEDEVLAGLETILSDGDIATTGADIIDLKACRLLDNFHHDSFPRLLTLLDEAQDQVKQTKCPVPAVIQAEQGIHQGVETLKGIVRPFFPAWNQHAIYSRHKFPGLEMNDIGDRLARIAEVTRNRVSYTLFSKHLLMLER
ncbi:MAG: surface carbohydrate biosynthesis protein [Bradymonadaceae bacterium]